MNSSRQRATIRLVRTGGAICGLVVGLIAVGAISWGQIGPSPTQQAQSWLKYGVEQAQQGDVLSAIEALQRAIQLDPGLQSAYYNLGLVLYQAGQPSPAAHYFQEALKLSPSDLQARRGLGLAYVAQAEYSRAAQVFRGLLEVSADDPVANMQLGRCYLSQGQPQQAIAWLEKAVKLQPDQPEAHLYLGQALAAAEKVVDAEASLLWSLKLRPDWVPAQLALLDVYVNSGRFLSAQPLVKKLLQEHSQDPDLLMAQVKVYDGLGLQQEKWKAEEALLSVLPPPEAVEGRLALAAEYFHAARYEQALNQLQKANTQHPGSPQIVEAIGQCYIKMGRMAKAVQVIEEAIHQGQSSPPLLLMLGDAYGRQAQYEQSLDAYQQALAANRDYLPALLGAASASRRLGKLKEAMWYQRQIVAMMPESTDERLALADQLFGLGELGEAMQQYAILAQELDTAAVAMSKLIVLAQVTDNRQFELQLRQQGQQLPEAGPDGRRAQLMAQQGDVAAAKQDVGQMLQEHPDNPELKAMLAGLLIEAGQQEQAEALLAEVLQAEPRHGQANYLQARLYMQEGKEEAAVPLLRRAIASRPEAEQIYKDLLNCTELTGQLPAATDFLTTVLADVVHTQTQRGERAVQVATEYLAEGYRRQGGGGRAAREMAAASDAYPQVPALAVTAGRALMDAGQDREAIKYYSRAALSPHYAGALVEATQRLLDRNLADALRAATKHLAWAAQDDQAIAWVAELLGGQQEVSSERRALLEQLLSARPGSVAYELAKVDLAEYLGRLPQAEARLATQVHLQPDDAAIVAGLAYALWRQGRIDEALTRLDMGPQSSGPDVAALRATLLVELGRLEEAQQEVVGQPRVGSRPQSGLLNARVLTQTKHYQQALWEYCQMLTRDPGMMAAMDGIVELYLQDRVRLSTLLTALGQVYEICPAPAAIHGLVVSLGDDRLIEQWLDGHPRRTVQAVEPQ